MPPGRPTIDTGLRLAAVFALIAANAFFVAAEFALVAADRARAEAEAEEGRRGAARALGLMQRLSYHLSAAQLGITITSLLLGFIAQPTAQRLLERLVGDSIGTGWSVVIALTIATVLQLVFGEIVPKSLAISSADTLSRRMSVPIQAYGTVSWPFVTVLNNWSNWLTRKLGVEPREELDSTPSLDELALLIKSSGEHGALDAGDVDLLTRVIRFSDKSADDAMVPRVEMSTLDATASVADLVAQSIDTGHSRFPVLGENVDDVVGVVHVKSVYAIPVDDRASAPITDIMSEVFAVPETRDLDLLLPEMQATSTHLAIVVDEHGGTAGLITVEDLLEEIVGEIDDEHDRIGALTKVEQAGSYVLRASLHRDEVLDACGFEMPDGPYETIAGFVLDRLGHIPEPSEIVEFDGWRIEVVAMQRRRIATVRVVAPGPR